MQDIIDKYNIKAKKFLGQNFLMNKEVLNQIVEITNIKDENILEIGPGFGSLTKFILSKKPKNLTLVEVDDFMIEVLNDRIKNKDLDISGVSFEIVNQDVLKFIPNFKDYKVIANIPYYITSPILHHFLYSLKNLPKEMIILMQKEVGDRIIGKKSSVLSLFVQKKCTISSKIFVSKKDFLPIPKVDSQVLFFEINNKYNFIDDEKFLFFIKSAFSNPRKKLINNLEKAGYDKNQIFTKLKKLGYNELVRAEVLKIQDFIYLLNNN